MPEPASYELLDFGHGRKLERFGGVVVDRPAPAAEHFVPARPESWTLADARYDRLSAERGAWHVPRPLPASWTLRQGNVTLELKLTDTGQVGVFPEQAANWRWTIDRVRDLPPPVNVLNLFAYTGASTLAAATAGAEVVHLDAAHSSVTWARHNATLSGLTDHPIRWIVDDARKFVMREVKRGHRYQGLILDPPTYGHGPDGRSWKLAEHLPALLRACRQIWHAERGFVLLTCHALFLGPQELRAMLAKEMALPLRSIQCGDLPLFAIDGRALPSGIFARADVAGPKAS